MIQALLTQQEYDECAKKYKTFNPGKRRTAKPWRKIKVEGKEFMCGPPPNYNMGDSLSPKEIKIFNDRIDTLKELVKTENLKS